MKTMTVPINRLQKVCFVAGILLSPLLSGFAQATFTKITSGAIVNDGGSSAGCAWGDFDNDGFEDLFVANSNGEDDFLYRNNRNGTFTRVTTGSIVTSGGYSTGCAWGDFDNDGYLDLFVANGGDGSPANNFLFRNNGNGTFTRINAGPVGTDFMAALTAAWADYDRDGWLDLFVGDYGGANNQLYRNTGAGSFTRVVGHAFVDSQSIGCAWGDYNNDGFPDLFVARGQGELNRLYRNNGNGTFAAVPSSSPGYDHSVSADWGDYDNDGILDLFVGAGGNLIQISSALYRGDGAGAFASSGIVTDAGYGATCAWGDYDNDGFLDLLLARQHGQNNLLYHNNGDGTFTRVTTGSVVNDGGNSVGCAWADYDNDGFLDMFVGNGAWTGAGNNFLYHNDGNGNHWLKLKLIGGPSNHAAIGAKVRLTTSIGGVQRWQMREISGGNGFCQNSLVAHFGLGSATNADVVRIEWPSGTVQELHNVGANQFLTITEPPGLQAAGLQPDGSFKMLLTGASGLRYDLQTSSNLALWTFWQTITNTSRTISITVSNATGFAQRFYRAVAQ